ncbi:hypothetical protein niasHS_005817 [Heterodera schachtii]|uniref:Uncharacterized protein n=1 Tax=Heterodera schachtii TaxID=97005 RepID=A0ABD2JZQ7_HETSC
MLFSANKMPNFLFIYAIFVSFSALFSKSTNVKRKCFKRVHASRTFVPEVESSGDPKSVTQRQKTDNGAGGVGTTFRTAKQDVYLWPTLSDHEKLIIRDAFHQIHRRSCIRFNELNYKPWYHHERWSEGRPYVVIRKSKKFFGYSDNKIEEVNKRSLIYLSEKSLNVENVGNSSRGMVMEQLLKFMGFREEFLRPDAPSYLKPIPASGRPSPPSTQPKFSNEQLMWPFDPESISMPALAREWFKLTIYCQARQDADIGAGQRSGILTRWDAIKLNSMYCPKQVGYADPRMGPCVVPRKKLCKDNDGFENGGNGVKKREVPEGCLSLSKLEQNAKSEGNEQMGANGTDKAMNKSNENGINANGTEEGAEEGNSGEVSAKEIADFFNS